MKRAFLIAGIFALIAVSSAFAIKYRITKTDKCLVYAYTSEKRQTDHDPQSTAAGTKCHWGTVAANHLPLWTRLKIEGFDEKIFTVEDRHSKRYKKIIDIWFPDKKEAKKFGVRRLRYWIVKDVKPLP